MFKTFVELFISAGICIFFCWLYVYLMPTSNFQKNSLFCICYLMVCFTCYNGLLMLVLNEYSAKLYCHHTFCICLQTQHDELESKFFEERAVLEAKYQKLYQPLYTKVCVNGNISISTTRYFFFSLINVNYM